MNEVDNGIQSKSNIENNLDRIYGLLVFILKGKISDLNFTNQLIFLLYYVIYQI